MHVPELRIEQAQFDAIRRHGEAAYPDESCGVLLGRAEEGVNTVVDAVRAANTRTDSAHNRYQIAPQELIRIQRTARQQELDIVGFYHSHPDHPAQWSKTDLAEAHWFGCSYIITSVQGDNSGTNGIPSTNSSTTRCRATETNSFLLTGTGEEDKRLVAQPIEVSTPAAATANA
jgi:proteasome lid subunit RPN8/RPN11